MYTAHMNKNWNTVATDDAISRTVLALSGNGIAAHIVSNAAEAKEKLFSLIPEGAEVMTMTSVTLDAIGATAVINESGTYDSVKAKLKKMNRETDGREMQKLGAAPDYAVGSVHAVTEDGKVMIASNSGSQLPAYAYGANHVIWVVGAQKVVMSEEDGKRRIYEYVLPLESERAKKAYGVAGSFVSKLLTINQEVNAGRLTMIIVKESLGF